MDEGLDPRGLRRLGHAACPGHVDGAEPLLALFDADRGKIDHRRGAAHCRRDRIGVADIDLHRHDLTDAAERPHMTNSAIASVATRTGLSRRMAELAIGRKALT